MYLKKSNFSQIQKMWSKSTLTQPKKSINVNNKI